jgi:hypothetical protein
MKVEAIKEAAHANPFVPFALRLTDGSQVVVPHSDFIFLTRGGRTLIVNLDDDNFRMVDSSLVTALEFGPALVHSKNGPGKQ